ncbi:hypothetical protein GGS23DRAFT_610211 [Durotheca rogersii]|uniref:uncharacterized protein n=1 Tax=Durotheca rogersii TaxID=419775 RepID=UPI00222103D9|nr:uncharacterized protein GGS23DRAFT_610211 [Durotheca rogersii]KAI5862532.1 hypothetical protein GGS23DRAFT_610211 [Durotheca rogersii]
MKLLNVLLLATSVSALAIDRTHTDVARSADLEEVSALLARHHAGRPAAGANGNNRNGANGRNGGNRNGGNGANTGNNNNGNGANAGNGTSTGNGGADTSTSGNTLVLKEVNGVPGNECLTFRNNGEIVDAACVNAAADRQITPTTVDGAAALRVQRSFAAGFRPDLVGVAACVGFNGTHFRAEDCAAAGIELVQLDGAALRTPSGACASGHDNLAQVTVDPTGAACASFESTVVAPTAP